MKFLFASSLLVFVLCCPLNSAFGADLTGMVLMHECGGSPVSGVQVSAIGAGGPVRTGQDGIFRLQFPDFEPGDDVKLNLKKEGLRVVNSIMLDQRLPKVVGTNPVILLLSTPEEREVWARKFYRLEIDRVTREQYEKRLASLKEGGGASHEEYLKIQQELERIKSEKDEIVKGLASRQQEDDFNQYDKGWQLYLSGDVDGALRIFDREKLERDAALVESNLKKVAKGFADRARILLLQFDFEGADGAFKRRSELLPNDFWAQYDYAGFLYKQRDYSKAEVYTRKALGLAEEGSDDNLKSIALNSLGVVVGIYGDRQPEALRAFEEALKIRRRLALKEPAVNEPDMAKVLNNLGGFYVIRKRLSEGAQAFGESLEIRRRLAQKAPGVYDFDVAGTLVNLGIALWGEGRRPEALQAYEESLEIYRRLALKNSVVCDPEIAMALSNLGLLLAAEDKFPEALEANEEALEIRQRLAKENPAAYEPDVAMTLNNNGFLHKTKGRYSEALQAYNEALAIYSRLAQKNPAAYGGYLGALQQNIRIVKRDMSK